MIIELEKDYTMETSRINQKIQLNAVSSQDALALAYAAYRVNGNQYIKDTRRFSTEGNDPIYSNKELVKYTLAFQRNEWIPDDFNPVKATPEDYSKVQDCKAHFRKYTMLALGEISDFQKSMYEIVSLKEHTVLDGRIAFIPQFVDNERAESTLKKTIRIEYRDSQWLGKEGDTVEGVVEILEARWSNTYERFNYNGVIDGNLVSFMNPHEHAIGDMKRIKAKIKAQTKNKLFEVPETRLNYVKLYKV